MSAEHRLTAIERIATLRHLLEAQPNASELAPFVEECEHLESAIQAFHMEAIRFRMFGLNRQMKSGDHTLPGEALTLLDEAREALETAGFRVK